jgi:hypothetical protein
VIPFAFVTDWWKEQTLALQIFWGTGLFALVLIVLQAGLGLFLGHDGDTPSDVPGEHDSGSYLSLKTISALLLGLGFGGVYCLHQGYSTPVSAFIGLVVGLVIAVVYLLLMSAIYSLRSDGTANLHEAIGQSGTVYLRVPGNNSGAGEIQVSISGTLQNVKAYTAGTELSTGAGVRVTALRGNEALVVEKLS